MTKLRALLLSYCAASEMAQAGFAPATSHLSGDVVPSAFVAIRAKLNIVGD